MNTKTVMDKLGRVEAILSEVLDGYAKGIPQLRNKVESAAAIVGRALSFVEASQLRANQEVAATKTAAPKPNRGALKSRKRTSTVAKMAATSAQEDNANKLNRKKKVVYRGRRKAWPRR